MKNMSRCGDSVIATGCTLDCGRRCVLKLHIKAGTITRITTDDQPEPQLRACAKGRAWRMTIYSPDRLKYPLKRVGPRGEGRFKRIAWDDALDIVARKMRLIKQEFGTEAILEAAYAGSVGFLHSTMSGPLSRLLSMFGGRTTLGTFMSSEAMNFASNHTYGTTIDGNEATDFLNSKLVILWGYNPVVSSSSGCNTAWYLAQAKETGCEIICVDPRYSETAMFADKWIPIRPSTDAAMLIAMGYVITSEELHDEHFLDTYTIGFDKYKEYLLGLTDGVPKTPEWAETITGVKASSTRILARKYASIEPAALMLGFAPGRTSYGEQYARAGIALQAMTANIGIPGGSSHCVGRIENWSTQVKVFPVEGEKPEETIFHRKSGLRMRGKGFEIKTGLWADAVLLGKSGGYPSDIRMIYVVGSNILNQTQNPNKGVKALKKVDFIVVHERFLTPTAKFADILLPVTTHFERNDIAMPRTMESWVIYTNKAIEPMYEAKSDLEICTELAKRLDISDFNIKSEEEWLRSIVSTSEISDYKKFKIKGVWRPERKEHYVAFRKQIEDPSNNPFPTPSGKIEIFSDTLAEMGFPPIPTYMNDWEGPHHSLSKKYPLQLVTVHPIYRVHSQFHDNPWLQELYVHQVWINTSDAKIRGVKNGDNVRVFNDVGQILINAKITERIMPGVVCIPEGGWYDPDEQGLDVGGCCNTLIKDKPSPAGAQNYNTCLVQIEKWG